MTALCVVCMVHTLLCCVLEHVDVRDCCWVLSLTVLFIEQGLLLTLELAGLLVWPQEILCLHLPSLGITHGLLWRC